MLVFWDVDTQRDFIEPDGALHVPGAETIKPALAMLTRVAIVRGYHILGSVDRHFIGDEELKTFPPHCMDRTNGQLKIRETLTSPIFVESKPHAFSDPVEYRKNDIITMGKATHQIIFEKQEVDVFSNPNTDIFIKHLEVGTAIVYGVVTEICVRAAVLGLQKRGIQTWLIPLGMKSLDPAKGVAALTEMQEAGAKVCVSFDSLIEVLNAE